MKKPLFVISIITFFLTCSNNLSGTNDETVIRTGAYIYEPDGKTPSVGAIVKVFKTNANDGQYVSKQTTDNNGKYALTGLSNGTYNIWAEKDSFVTFQDSVFISDPTTSPHNDTLKCPSTLAGTVGIQPQDDPRTVTIQVIGTDKYFNNTDDEGCFVLKGMAAGKYSLLLKSTLPQYTPTTFQVTVDACSNDTLEDTTWLIYTGIPVVTSLSIDYDTLNGVTHILWKKTTYRNLQSYVVYRDYYDSVILSSKPIAAVSDTLFSDTIFKRNLLSGLFSFSDTNDYHFKYRVAIRNNSQQEGLSFKFAEIIAATPQKVKTSIEYQSYHMGKGYFSDSASVNDSVRFSFNIINPNRKLVKVNYTDLKNDSVIYSSKIDSIKQFKDTLFFIWGDIGIKKIGVYVEDQAGTIWKDTILFQVVKDQPIVHIETSEIVFNSTTKIIAKVSDKFGKIVKCEWKIGNDNEYIATSSNYPEITIDTKDTIFSTLFCVIRVTDDDSTVSADTVLLNFSFEWQKIIPPSDMGNIFTMTDYNGKLLSFSSGLNGGVWELATDGNIFSKICNNTKWSDRVQNVAVLNNKLFILDPMKGWNTWGNFQNDKSTIWMSSNGTDWDSLFLDNFPIYPYTYCPEIMFCSFGNNLFIKSQDTSSGAAYFWSSTNGESWVQGYKVTQNGFWSMRRYSYISIDSILLLASDYSLWQTKDLSKFEQCTFGQIVGLTSNQDAGGFGMVSQYKKYPMVIVDQCGDISKLGIYYVNTNKEWQRCSLLPDKVTYKQFYSNTNRMYIVTEQNEIWVSK